ncbi:hypothetical protein SAMN05421504_101259 [Amycolatopsis xylanica]|uniref:Uncharacterized protein n=1 Tax=Amycolatopsis xylanica TaxID=589385 RepID=A0A1H2SKN8_9PSEU|nr:hypothetical protein [Amycolatopsis xylanica]SDW32263.1 hypothetical protein SAMN05421504_101259 [Amycolatopsis xylanica]
MQGLAAEAAARAALARAALMLAQRAHSLATQERLHATWDHARVEALSRSQETTLRRQRAQLAECRDWLEKHRVARSAPASSVTVGEWTIEIRRVSAYLRGDGDLFFDPDDPPRHAVLTIRHDRYPFTFEDTETASGIAFPRTDLGKIVAVLDQVLGHPAYFDFRGRGGVIPGQWSEPETVDGWVHLSGPLVAFGTRIGDWVPTPCVELFYSNIAELRDKLRSVPAGRTVRCHGA